MAAASPSANPTPPEDWPAQAADTIVKVVGTVRDRTTGTAISVAGKVVAGVLISVLGITALVLLCILVDRGLVVLLREALDGLGINRAGRANWIADVLMGVIVGGAGLWMWKKATSAPAA